MDTLADMRTAVYSDLTASPESTLFPTTTVDLAINRAYRKAGGLFKWPKLEDAKTTTTQSGIEYYDAPETWRPDSIWRIEVGGVQYGETPDGSPMKYEDYLIWRADSANANSTEKKWAVQWHRFFIYPVPTAANIEIALWGYENVEKLVNDADTTIFSYSMPECNEAVVLEAVAILKGKGEDDKAGQFRSIEAKQVLATAWNKIRMEQGKYEKSQPMFNVPDYFSGKSTTSTVIGNF